MRVSPRWRKLFADFGSIQGRLGLVVAALAVGLISTITITTAFSILTRDIKANYLGTNPASGILDVGHVDDMLVKRVGSMPGIAAAEPLSIVETRARKADGSGNWRALVFVSPDPLAQSLNSLRLESRLDPFPRRGVYLERRALELAGVQLGDSIQLEIPGAGFADVAVGGAVFDPSLAPAQQEQTVYVYLDQKSYAALGGASNPEMIKIQVADTPFDQAHVDKTLVSTAAVLRDGDVPVHLVQSPNAGMHPHEGQMRGILALFLLFGVLAFLLSSVLVSVTVEGLMAQQIRQIAIQKTIGGSTRQIAIPYLAGIITLGLATLVPALPIGVIFGERLASAIAYLLNFDILDASVPYYWWAGWIFAGLAVPVLAALRPVSRATGATVTEALSDIGIGRSKNANGVLNRICGALFSGQALLALRGAFRRQARTLMILGLLSLAGAMFLTSQTVSRSYQASVDIAAAERRHDAEIRLTAPLSRDVLNHIISETPPIASAQLFVRREAAGKNPDGVALVRTYPDGGHGSIILYAGSNETGLKHHVVLAGNFPINGLDGQLVVNQGAWSLLGYPEIGDVIHLSLDGNALDLPLSAVVRQYMTPAAVYAADGDVAATTGAVKLNVVRIVAKAHDVSSVDAAVAALEARVDAAGSGVALAITENLMDQAVSGHVRILIFMLFALGVLMAIVGFLGLTAAQGISVTERTREFGIIRAIGGQRRQILSSLLAEGLIIAAVSLPFAVLLSLPLSYLVDRIVGQMTFGMPLPFTLDLGAIGLWSALAVVGALVASLPPAFNASRLSVRETLVQT
jgi:putative ABC transport system permease protein